ncbi:hypothetical protein [Sutcliffiella rhizosphaerae]|uniref:Uncharacterized protein n=1 Tax=Sutcliffiella rhizosphaerae TaxID=2880967 RepID=A0ABN8A6J7_9BACI|nr:hypothetical protein [Sutcliffiella rhizosphaerae]CAG9620254.1 hypothetical protein BACCIP111883_01022 [Sutcliffiella rhizosphaerae]
MEKNEPVDNVVKFEQSESMKKEFRHDLPVSEELKEVLLIKIYNELAQDIVQKHFSEARSVLEAFIDEHRISGEKRPALLQNLFWWRILYQVNHGMEVPFVEDYIAKNITFLKDKPLITSWLKEWEKAVTKFYYVGYMYNNRNMVLVDILTNETLDVVIYDRTAIPPKSGEIVLGTLLPIGDGLYFPIIDFYHFDYQAREHVARQVKRHLTAHFENSSLLETFIHLLSQALQIEQRIESDQPIK